LLETGSDAAGLQHTQLTHVGSIITSAACYSLIETAKASNLNPQVYIKHILDRIAVADTLEKLEALLPWNVKLG
jgi:hypothetical protein